MVLEIESNTDPIVSEVALPSNLATEGSLPVTAIIRPKQTRVVTLWPSICVAKGARARILGPHIILNARLSSDRTVAWDMQRTAFMKAL